MDIIHQTILFCFKKEVLPVGKPFVLTPNKNMRICVPFHKSLEALEEMKVLNLVSLNEKGGNYETVHPSAEGVAAINEIDEKEVEKLINERKKNKT